MRSSESEMEARKPAEGESECGGVRWIGGSVAYSWAVSASALDQLWVRNQVHARADSRASNTLISPASPFANATTTSTRTAASVFVRTIASASTGSPSLTSSRG